MRDVGNREEQIYSERHERLAFITGHGHLNWAEKLLALLCGICHISLHSQVNFSPATSDMDFFMLRDMCLLPHSHPAYYDANSTP